MEDTKGQKVPLCYADYLKAEEERNGPKRRKRMIEAQERRRERIKAGVDISIPGIYYPATSK